MSCSSGARLTRGRASRFARLLWSSSSAALTCHLRSYLSKATPLPPSPTKPPTPLPSSPRIPTLTPTSTSTPFTRPHLPSYHSAPASPTLSSGLRSPSPTRTGFARPASPLKAQHTGGRVQVNSEGEELRAFGCVIGKTQWCCAACGGRFRQVSEGGGRARRSVGWA